MFCDISGSTALSTRLDPEDLSTVLRSYQSVVRATIAGFVGFIARYLARAAGIVRDDAAEERLRKLRNVIDAETTSDCELLAELLSLPNSAAALNLSTPRKREKLSRSCCGNWRFSRDSSRFLLFSSPCTGSGEHTAALAAVREGLEVAAATGQQANFTTLAALPLWRATQERTASSILIRHFGSPGTSRRSPTNSALRRAWQDSGPSREGGQRRASC